MAIYHDPKTKKQTEAKNLTEAKKAFKPKPKPKPVAKSKKSDSQVEKKTEEE